MLKLGYATLRKKRIFLSSQSISPKILITEVFFFLTHVHKFFDIPAYRGWNLIPIPLNVARFSDLSLMKTVTGKEK